MAEKTESHFFKIDLSKSDSERFKAYLRKTGVKKMFVAREAILRYIEENEKDSVS